MGPGGVIETFTDFKRSTKVLIWVMLAFGVALFAVCLTADLTGAQWMNTYAYIPNILAGLTGFLIGVPFALVVLATLASQRDDKSAADRVNAVTQIAWNQFRDAISDLCSEQRIEAMESGAKRVSDIHDQTWHGFNNRGSDMSDEAFQTFIAFAGRQSAAWGEAIRDLLNGVGGSADLRLRWFAVRRDWNTLDQYVRLQRLERGLTWFPREIDSALQQHLATDQHPMRSFFEMHEYHYPNNNMFAAHRAVEALSHVGNSQETFNRFISQDLGHFPTTRVNGYLAVVDQCAVRMRFLRTHVLNIEDSGWPTNA